MRRAERFAELETTTLECRNFGHSWIHDHTELVRRGVVELHVHCDRCPTTRVDVLRRSSGEILGHRYSYQAGYLIADAPTWGSRRTFNANVRVALVERYERASRPKLRAVR